MCCIIGGEGRGGEGSLPKRQVVGTLQGPGQQLQQLGLLNGVKGPAHIHTH